MPRKTTLGGVRPHTRKVAEEILDRWVIYYVWGIGSDGHHAAGRAIDFMVLTEDQRAIRTRVGNEIAAYVRRHHRRLGVQYVIWRRRIWNATRSDDRSRVEHHEWRWMEDRGNPTANHMDHPHVSLLNNPPPYRAPDGSARPSGSTDDGLLERGDRGPAVRELQRLLNEHNYELKVDGVYGPRTEAAVRAYQRENGLTVDGVAGPVTLGHLQEGDVSAEDVWTHEWPYHGRDPIQASTYLSRTYVHALEAHQLLKGIAEKVGAPVEVDVDEAALAKEILAALPADLAQRIAREALDEAAARLAS